MTGELPYRTRINDRALQGAIRLKELPANLSSIPQDFLRGVLTACWQMDPYRRPRMDWCIQALSFGTTSRFHSVSQLPADNVPLWCAQKGNGWHAIRNPDASAEGPFEVAFRSDLTGIDAWCSAFSHPLASITLFF